MNNSLKVHSEMRISGERVYWENPRGKKKKVGDMQGIETPRDEWISDQILGDYKSSGDVLQRVKLTSQHCPHRGKDS